MKNKKIICVLVLIIIGAFFGYKCFMLNGYNPDTYTDGKHQENIRNFKEGKSYTVTKKADPSQKIILNDLSVKALDGFARSDSNSTEGAAETYYLSGEDEKNSLTSYMVTIGASLTDLFKNNTTEDLSKKDNLKFDPNKYLLSNGIASDVQLLKETIKKINDKVNIFTSVDKMREYYSFQMFAELISGGTDGINFITGNVKGYIIKYSTYTEINVYNKNDRYTIICNNNKYFTDKVIEELLSSVEFK